MIAAAAGLLGALAGLGLLLALHGMFPRSEPLADQARRLHRPTSVVASGRGEVFSAWEVRVARPRSARPAFDRACDLAVIGCSNGRWLRWRTGVMAISAVVSVGGAIVHSITMAVATVEASPSTPAVADAAQQPSIVHTAAVITASCFGGLLLAWGGAEWLLMARARSARSVFQAAVACYLELVAVSLAAGSGPAAAMRSASSIGDGWAFRSIRAAVAHAELQLRSPYQALDDLGLELGVTELSEVGSALALAEQQGAPIRSVLEVKSRAVTSRLVTADRAEAETRSVAMSLPSVLMLSGFLLFLMYPFVAALLATTA